MTVAEFIKELEKFDHDKSIDFIGHVKDYFGNHKGIIYGFDEIVENGSTVWLKLKQYKM